MRLLQALPILIAACGLIDAGHAQLLVVSNTGPSSVFGGGRRSIPLVLNNRSGQSVQLDGRARVFQTTSATAVQIADKPWKRIQVLPGQTIIESASIDFPAVRAETRFIVQWWESTNRVVGTTEVLAYPTNLLHELKQLVTDGEILGVFDPQNVLKPLLNQAKVDFADLAAMALEDFRGKLAVILSNGTHARTPHELTMEIATLASKGVAVVWIQRLPENLDKLEPSFYSVVQGAIATVIAQPTLVANLADNPRSQLNLIRLCKLSVSPEPPHLPNFDPQP